MMDFIKSKKILMGIIVICTAIFLFEIFLPKSLAQKEESIYVLQKGMGYKEIARDLDKNSIIRSEFFFKFYVLASFNYSKLQAGNYELSPSMSIAKIVEKFTSGDVVKNTITIIEGWDIEDIAKNLNDRGIYFKEDFINASKTDFSDSFPFLREKPKGVGLEGYIFPDTYYIAENTTAEEFLKIALLNFDEKITSEMRQEIERQDKSIFEIITMASMVEKEVQTFQDKKIVAGILWKRIKEGIPLQVDATVNYVTGKNDEKVATNDTKIDSPYNTYKYYGLPLGPISNPGIDSILAAIYPTKTDYWYYLSADGNGMTIFSKTLDEHNAAISKYFK